MSILDRLRRRRPSPAPDEANAKAAERAARELERVRGQWPTVLQYAASLTEHRQRNHFSELIAGIYKGDR